MGKPKSWKDLPPLPPRLAAQPRSLRLCVRFQLMAMLADGLQVGPIVSAARCLVGDVVNLVRRSGDTSSKTDPAEIAISLEDALS